jgi:hypothetical protein
VRNTVGSVWGALRRLVATKTGEERPTSEENLFFGAREELKSSSSKPEAGVMQGEAAIDEEVLAEVVAAREDRVRPRSRPRPSNRASSVGSDERGRAQ